MAEWRDEAVVLAVRRFGETSLILEVLTPAQGRSAGLLKGGARGRKGGAPQPGDHVHVQWRARLAEHLGNFTLDPVRARAARLFGDARGLAGLSSALSLARLAPEGEANPGLFEALTLTLNAMAEGRADWPALYALWELGLLEALGYGLDLTACAATGEREDLAYVSPKSGRAVARAPGAPYHDRLFRLPAFLRAEADAAPGDVIDALKITGHFLTRRIFEPMDAQAPASRARLLAKLAESAGEEVG